MTVDLAIVPFMGFRTKQSPSSGLVQLHRKATAAFSDRTRTLLFLPRPWDTNIKRTAKLLMQWEPRKIAVWGHSYGCGWAGDRFIKLLAREYHRDVDLWFLLDPVVRYWLIPRLIPWPRKALTLKDGHSRPIPIPESVHLVACYRQLTAPPFGHHPLVASGSTTTVIEDVPINDPDVTHANIDGRDELHEKALQLTAEL